MKSSWPRDLSFKRGDFEQEIGNWEAGGTGQERGWKVGEEERDSLLFERRKLNNVEVDTSLLSKGVGLGIRLWWTERECPFEEPHWAAVKSKDDPNI